MSDKSKKGNLLCAIGIHRPLTAHVTRFTDFDKVFYTALCPCGKTWMVDSTNPYLGDKVEVKE